METHHLCEALFQTEDEIEIGLINALLDAYEQGEEWPMKLYHSARGVRLLSVRTYVALGAVVRSIDGDELTARKREQRLNSEEGREFRIGSSKSNRSASFRSGSYVTVKSNRQVSRDTESPLLWSFSVVLRGLSLSTNIVWK